MPSEENLGFLPGTVDEKLLPSMMSFLIVIDEIKAVVTRLGEDAQSIFACDNKQHDLRGMTGVEYIVDLVKKARINRPDCLDTEEVNELITNVGIVEFTQDDVVRSGLCRSFVKLFNAEGSKK